MVRCLLFFFFFPPPPSTLLHSPLFSSSPETYMYNEIWKVIFVLLYTSFRDVLAEPTTVYSSLVRKCNAPFPLSFFCNQSHHFNRIILRWGVLGGRRGVLDGWRWGRSPHRLSPIPTPGHNQTSSPPPLPPIDHQQKCL